MVHKVSVSVRSLRYITSPFSPSHRIQWSEFSLAPWRSAGTLEIRIHSICKWFMRNISIICSTKFNVSSHPPHPTLPRSRSLASPRNLSLCVRIIPLCCFVLRVDCGICILLWLWIVSFMNSRHGQNIDSFGFWGFARVNDMERQTLCQPFSSEFSSNTMTPLQRHIAATQVSGKWQISSIIREQRAFYLFLPTPSYQY